MLSINNYWPYNDITIAEDTYQLVSHLGLRNIGTGVHKRNYIRIILQDLNILELFLEIDQINNRPSLKIHPQGHKSNLNPK